MIADGNAAQSFAIFKLYEREIACAATDINHKHQRHCFESRSESVTMPRGEIVKGGLWFFDQSELFETGAAGSRDSQRARNFVKRCGHRDDDFEILEQSFGVSVIPCVADVEKQTRRRVDRRHLLYIRRSAPWQNWSRPIDPGVRKPRFRRCDQAGWNL